jgi:hypothetical protein
MRDEEMSPQRIQLRRTKGWRKPEGAIVVSRPTTFGNPFRPILSDCCPNWDVIDDNDVRYLVDHKAAHRLPPRVTTRAEAVAESVRLFADDLTYWFGGRMEHDPELAAAIGGLRGHDLACWCPLDQPCHADVLLKIANASGGTA